MLSSLEQKRVWEGMLAAEIRAHYFAYLCGRYQLKQRLLTWATLLFSSGALATLISDWVPHRLAWIRPVLAFFTVALSLWSLTAKNERNSIDCSDLHFKWNTVGHEFEDLWDDMYSDSAPETLRALERRTAEYSRSGTGFPYKRRLMVKCEDHVVQHRIQASATP
jgi:hypothetical protein